MDLEQYRVSGKGAQGVGTFDEYRVPYTIQSGDTMQSVMSKFGRTVNQVFWPSDNWETPLQPGQTIYVNYAAEEKGQIPTNLVDTSATPMPLSTPVVGANAQKDVVDYSGTSKDPKLNSTSASSKTTANAGASSNPVPPPNVNLSPGSSGQNVTQLQNWLISQGYNIPSGPTGYYGIQTKRALAQWQDANKVDTGGNAGFYGPKTIQAIASTGTGGTSTGVGASSASVPADNGLDQTAIDGLNYIFTSDQISKLSPTDQKQWAMIGEYLKKQSDLGQASNVSSEQTLNDAYHAALKDPTLSAKYGDIEAADRADFSFNLNQASSALTLKESQDKITFDNQKKQLAESSAEAGQAYSGYRKQAENILGTQQGGVINSTLADASKSIRSIAEPLEKYYGSSKFNSLFGSSMPTLNYMGQTVSYQPLGNLTGTEAASKEADVLSKTSSIFSGLNFPATA